MKGPDPVRILRKRPAQGRSRQTVDIILQAGSQLLGQGAEAELTTTAVADRAGVSVGTLYQYFADRDAILLALATRERQRVTEQLRRLLAQLDPRSPDPTREFVRILVRSFAGRRGAAKQFALMARLNPAGGRGLVEEVSEALSEHWNRHTDDDTARCNRTYAYVLTHAISGVLMSAALENKTFLKDADFEDALCLIVWTLRPVFKLPT